MRTHRPLVLLALLLTLIVGGLAQARVVFGTNDFAVSDFKNLDKALATCDSSSPSFLCRLQNDTITRIPTKGVDLFFDGAGELVAAYAKAQKGQTYNDYPIDRRQNLIPYDSTIPGAAVLIDGSYSAPQDVSGSWQRSSDIEFKGTFHYREGGYRVERVVTVSAIREHIGVQLTVTPVAGAQAGAGSGAAAGSGSSGQAASGGAPSVSLVTPGIAGTAEPVVKIGHGADFTLNPPAGQGYSDPTYASLQNNNNNTGDAIVLRPAKGATGVEAEFLKPDRVALTTSLAAGGPATLSAQLYTGRNELVRYYQEGYLGLPGLFRPNILGRLSLYIVELLVIIHGYVGSWGLAIIVLTLLFRVLIWPLIATQTKSMFGMQKLQPKIQELQKKYKDDREKLTQETMKLYQEAGVNPAGGCLPILLQMPLFIILWRVFVNFEFNQGFLWLPDLGQADPFYILPVLYVLVMLATSWFSARGNPQTLRQSMFINLIFVFIIINFPAGVLLYYVVSMLVQVFQYWLVSRGQPAPVVPAKRAK
ncbi:MAG TPA: YidC/Oxa1 family membrane protein insertase [Trueperaceae bacterium]|nr:YidC/Oxa1 family membrane protein insertase [Trueperaceae bacterium]